MTMQRSLPTSALLRAKLGLYTGPLDAAFARLWGQDKVNELVPAFLVLLHQIMRASVPLMECAVRRCEQLQSDDPLAETLASYYRHHIEEEQDHEQWALEDLQEAGFDPQTALNQIPPPQVAQLLGAQYYWILHHHPIMLLGLIMVLEAYPPSSSLIDKIRDSSGVPEAAFKTLRMHGELDPHHSAELDEFMDSLPLSRQHIAMIETSLLSTMDCLTASIVGLTPIQWSERS
jgi:hypothetical protein